jgi:hypothetical protein
VSQDGGIDDAVVLVVLDEQDGFPISSHAWPLPLAREMIASGRPQESGGAPGRPARRTVLQYRDALPAEVAQ